MTIKNKIYAYIKLLKKLHKLECTVALLHMDYYNKTVNESLYNKRIVILEKKIDDILKMKNY